MSQVSLPLDVSKAMEDASRVFGRYVLLQQLGRGGMGTVYKAWQIPLKRYVAIKILHEGESEDNLARFMREAQTASQLHHPNIAAIYEVGNHAGRFFIAMQFIDGVTMDGLFERKLEREKLLKILRAASLAVHAAHEKGVVHRDLKPSNIMLSKEGRPFVLDFGIARQMRGGDTLTEAGMVVGTPTYMAPEQASGNPQMVDRRSDVWSLGVILYEILAGTVPHRGRSPAETLMYLVNQDPPAPSTRAPGVPRDLEAVCMKALERERRRRYATAEEFAADLQRWLDGTAVAAKPLTVVEKLSRKLVRLRRQLVAAAVMLVLAGAASVGWGVVQRTQREKQRREAREAMAREKWTDALRLWERLGDDPEARVKAAECQQRLDEMQRMSSLRAGQAEMDRANAAWREAMKLVDEPGQHVRLRELLRESEGHARAALKSYSADGTWWLRLGEILYELRDAGCVGVLGEAVRRDPSLKQAYFLRAKMNATRIADGLAIHALPSASVRALLGDMNHDLTAAVEHGLEPEKQLLLRAMTLVREEDYRGAEEALRPLYEKNREDLDVQDALARVWLALEKLDDLERVTRRLCDKRPNNPFYLLRSAQSAFARKDARAGLDRTSTAIAMDPDNLRLRHLAACALFSVGAMDNALHEFDCVLRGEPANCAARYGRADALDWLDRRNEAVALFAEVSKNSRDALCDDAHIYALVMGRDYIAGIDESRQLLASLENSSNAYARRMRHRIHAFRGIAYRALSQIENSLREFERSIELGSTEAQWHFFVAEALVELKRDLGQAQLYFDKGRLLSRHALDKRIGDYVESLMTKAKNNQ
jgi:predicted Ser/Thr protein kinase/tetratricopeptide (TPR) repeat protein